ncbi:Ribonuclease Y [Oceanibacterium hippocampi]|uniref:Ribonuclease Y n=2 Tax=Oceanibacterium hippocampi TaxID=745714 RepID=A0A1Y5RJX7_9PROT|nr:Ribonuclease Y [Oceanibacterium hippocampi]
MTGNRSSPLAAARALLSATAIKALADDRWETVRPWIDYPLLVAFVVFLTLLFTPPNWRDAGPLPVVGAIAESTIRADRDLLIEDDAATELRRKAAEASVKPIFNYDPELYFNIVERVNKAAAAMAARAASKELEEAERRLAFQKDLGQPVNATVFALLEAFEDPADVARAINTFVGIGLDHMVVAARDELPRRGGIQIRDTVTQNEWQLTDPSRVIDLGKLRRLVQARAATATYGEARIVRSWVLETALALVRPNLIADLAATGAAREQKRAAVEATYVKIAADEVIVREGDRVTQAALDRLHALQEKAANRPYLGETGAFGALVTLMLLLGALFFQRSGHRFRLTRKQVYITLAVSAGAALLGFGFHFAGRGIAVGLDIDPRSGTFLIPVATATILIALLVDARTSLLAGIGLSLMLTHRVGGDIWLLAYYLLGVLVAGVTARRVRRRSELLRSGLAIGLVQAISVPMVLVLGAGGGAGGTEMIVVSCFFALFSGAISAMVATGALPVIEHIFDEATDMRLLELASADNPLLKQIALLSPGTYYHSVMIANLAEAAGEAIGANPIKCRVMALYHDLGKSVRPAYFAENQHDGNIHDRLPPELSARIIFAHIKDGIDIARKHRLGRAVLDAITQHQGTTLLQVFYDRAVEQAKTTGQPVREEDFRYPGPKPRSREAAILLFADSVEAATRALKSPGPAELEARIASVMDHKIADGQLEESDLTIRDLAAIRDAFRRTLTLGVYHSRIEYPQPLKPVETGGRRGDDNDERPRDRRLGFLRDVARRSS